MTVRMKAPKDAVSACVGGELYQVDASGHVEVSAAHFDSLLSHGYIVAVTEKTEPVNDDNPDDKDREPTKGKLGLKKDK